MKLHFNSGIRHHLYPNLHFRAGFNKPPGEWVLFLEVCLWKWQTNMSVGDS